MDNDTPLHDAVVNGHLRLIKLLVEKGADIHAKNAKGKSPLELASSTVQPYLLNTSLPLPGKLIHHTHINNNSLKLLVAIILMFFPL